MFKLTWILGALLGACAIGVLAGLLTSNTAALVWCLATVVWLVAAFQSEDRSKELTQHLEHAWAENDWLMQHLENAWAENDRLRRASNKETSEST